VGRVSDEILRVENLEMAYPIRGTKKSVRAVDGVSFALERGESFGIVGESGCGKSTTARLVVRLEDPTAGRILLDGQDITTLSQRALQPVRRKVQLVFQDPYSSLNPRRTVGDAVAEVLKVAGLGGGTRPARAARVAELLEMVGLRADFAQRFPHQMSGGQRQRIGIARALAVEPQLLVLDEPVSALDVSVQAGIMNLLSSLREELGLTYIFISHDLGMVRHISDRIGVMYLGRMVEVGPWDRVSDDPLHPYTRALQESVPVADPDFEAEREVAPLAGEVPDPADPPSGCRFHTRCPLVEPICIENDPPLAELVPGHSFACHVMARELARAGGDEDEAATRLVEELHREELTSQ
jgi:oligopeptide transport system ATP-binding protein